MSVTRRKPGRSRAIAGRGYLGEIPEEVYQVVDDAWSAALSIQSNYARENAVFVAMAASLGWITNISPDGLSYSRRWHCTMEGLSALRHRQ